MEFKSVIFLDKTRDTHDLPIMNSFYALNGHLTL